MKRHKKTDTLSTFRDRLGISQRTLAFCIGSNRVQIARAETKDMHRISSKSNAELAVLESQLNACLNQRLEQPIDTIALRGMETDKKELLKKVLHDQEHALIKLVFSFENRMEKHRAFALQYENNIRFVRYLNETESTIRGHELIKASRETALRMNQFSPAKQAKMHLQMVQLEASIRWAKEQLGDSVKEDDMPNAGT